MNSSLVLTEVAEEEEEEDQHREQRLTISEAFASDDVVAEFENEKSCLIEEDTIKNVVLDMPGWGSWGGENIKPRAR